MFRRVFKEQKEFKAYVRTYSSVRYSSKHYTEVEPPFDIRLNAEHHLGQPLQHTIPLNTQQHLPGCYANRSVQFGMDYCYWVSALKA